MSVAILQDNGDYGAVIVSGANLAIDPQGLAASWDKLDGARVLVLQNEVPDAVNVAAAAIARRHGATVVLNAAPARPLNTDLLAAVDVLVVNRIEAEAICGHPVPDRSCARAALPALGDAERAVVVTLGGNGLVCAFAGAVTEIEALPVKVTSTHGAGDCFVGVLAACLATGMTVVDACRTANERAAAFVSRPAEG